MFHAGASGYSTRTPAATRWFRTNAKQPKGIAVIVVIAIVVLIAVAVALVCAIMCIVKRTKAKRDVQVDPEAANTNADDDYIKQGKTHVAAANSCSLNIEPPAPQKAQEPYPYLQANGRPPFPQSEPERPLI